jgi:hypothetical protein
VLSLYNRKAYQPPYLLYLQSSKGRKTIFSTITDTPTTEHSIHGNPMDSKDTGTGSSNILPRGKFACFEEEGRDIRIRQDA